MAFVSTAAALRPCLRWRIWTAPAAAADAEDERNPARPRPIFRMHDGGEVVHLGFGRYVLPALH
jgi:hypothetical protein